MNPLIVLFLGILAFAPCHQAYAQRRVLRIPVGATKAEALVVLSSLHYFGSDGVHTYLVDGDGISAVAMIDDKVIMAGSVLAVFNACNPRATPDAAELPQDVAQQSGLRIRSISPASVREGEPARISLRIGYQLAGTRAGLIALRFNTESSQSFVVVAQQTVQPGSGEIEIEAEVVPKIHGSLTPFSASAVLIVADADDVRLISRGNRDIAVIPAQ